MKKTLAFHTTILYFWPAERMFGHRYNAMKHTQRLLHFPISRGPGSRVMPAEPRSNVVSAGSTSLLVAYSLLLDLFAIKEELKK